MDDPGIPSKSHQNPKTVQPWPQGDPQVIEDLAAVIRYVDGSHTLGAAELAAAILEDWHVRYGGWLVRDGEGVADGQVVGLVDYLTPIIQSAARTGVETAFEKMRQFERVRPTP